MKKTLSISLVLVCLSFTAFAQQDKALWVTIKSSNLRCWECKNTLEKYLVIENNTSLGSGLIQWKINLLQGEIKLQYYPDRVNPDMIRTAMNNAGFDADAEKAIEEAYKTVPQACKRAADGGGPQPRKPCHLEPIH